MRKVFVIMLGVMLLAQPLGAAPDDCNPTAGDQMHDWVDSQASQISRQLAAADYDTRMFNYFLVSLDDIHQRLTDESASLAAIDKRISTAETGYSGQDAVRAAVLRAADAQDLLNDLFLTRSEMDITRARYERLIAAPSHDQFVMDGFGNVGRATLLTSFVEMGSTAARSLQAKFNISMSFSVDTNGNINQASVVPQVGMVDTVAMAISAEIPEPYGACVFAAFEIVKFGITESECEDKIEHQKDLLDNAFRLLPSKLITDKEQYAMYSKSYSHWQSRFQEHNTHVKQALDLLDEEWSELLAYNVEREKAAQKVLTVEKLAMLSDQYRTDGAVTSLFNSVGVAEIAENIADVNSFLARYENELLQSCRSPAGLRVGEDYIDGLQYANAAYGLLQKQPSLVPLYDLMSRSLDQMASATSEADGIITSMLACKPAAPRVKRFASNSARITDRAPLTGRISSSASRAGTPLYLSRAVTKGHSLNSTDGPGWSFCTLVSTGGTYDCQDGAGGGSTYDSGFNGVHQDPYSGIFLSAQDGGYASDNRQVSADIGAATTNLKNRIADLQSRSSNAEAALPKWMSENEKTITNAIQEIVASKASIESNRLNFFSSNAADLASADASISTFLQTPYDRNSAGALLKNVAGTDLSLPAVPASAVLPDVPAIAGVTAISRVYGEASGIDRNILRESLKVTEQLAADSTLENQALEDIEDAKRFAATQTPQGRVIASALLDDAAALRYLHAGKLTKVSFSTISADGVLGRAEIDPGQPLPGNSLIQTISHFEGNVAIFDMKYNAAEAVIKDGVADYTQRHDVMQQSSQMASLAGSLFYQGEPTKGATILTFARTLVDLATAWLPGINWGRSIYEVVTGKNLITGAPLDSISYGAAVVAMCSGGIGEEEMSVKSIEDAATEVAELGHLHASEETMDLFNQVLAAEEHIAPELLKFDPHAYDGMRDLNLSESQVEKIIEDGKAYFDSSVLNKDNTGLVYLITESKIAALNGRPDTIILASVRPDIDNQVVATVYELEGVNSIAQAEEKVVSPLSGEKRFQPLPSRE